MKEANFCSHCGEPVQPSWKVCPVCGKDLPLGATDVQADEELEESGSEWAPEELRNNRLRVIGVLALIVVIALLWDYSRTDGGGKADTYEMEHTFSASRFSLEVQDVEMDERLPSWDDSNSSDDRSSVEKAASGIGEGLGQGLAEAIAGSSSDYDPDAYLVVYLEVTSDWERPKVADDLDFEVVDHAGETYRPTTSLGSLGHSPMQPGKKYEERLVFPILSDAHSLRLLVGDEAIVDLGGLE